MKKYLIASLAALFMFAGTADAYTHNATVKRVIDGDTVELADGRRVRYIGIDTPETGQCFAYDATRRNRSLVEGKQVQLVSDRQDKDVYGRLLRYVYLGGRSINQELVSGGYARAVYIQPNTAHYSEFRAIQDAARAVGRGLWGACR